MMSFFWETHRPTASTDMPYSTRNSAPNEMKVTGKFWTPNPRGKDWRMEHWQTRKKC